MSTIADNPLIDPAYPAGPLFDGPGPGSPPPVTDADLPLVLIEISRCASGGNPVRAFALMSWLMHGCALVPARVCRTFVRVFRTTVPDLAVPVVDGTVLNHRPVLDRLLEHETVRGNALLLLEARCIACRLHEAANDFDRAKAILVDMIASAREQEDPVRVARYTNNYAYEFLLEGDYRAALLHFREAAATFRSHNLELEIANAEANVLTCEFALSPGDARESLLPGLLESHRVLKSHRDWRIRKTMRLLAMRAETHGRLPLAIAWARRALLASSGLPTRLHHHDRAYYDFLRGRQRQGDLFDHARLPPTPQASRTGLRSI